MDVNVSIESYQILENQRITWFERTKIDHKFYVKLSTLKKGKRKGEENP